MMPARPAPPPAMVPPRPAVWCGGCGLLPFGVVWLGLLGVVAPFTPPPPALPVTWCGFGFACGGSPPRV